MLMLSNCSPQGKTAVQADIDAVAEAVDFLKFNHHYVKVLLISIILTIKSFIIVIPNFVPYCVLEYLLQQTALQIFSSDISYWSAIFQPV